VNGMARRRMMFDGSKSAMTPPGNAGTVSSEF